MTARIWVIAAIGSAVLVAGCGGDGGSGPEKSGSDRTTPATTASGPPRADEPLTAAARRLEQAVARGECRPLARLMLHSVVRGRGGTPTAPPTARECKYVRGAARGVLAGFKVKKVREFGPTGVVEGTGDGTRSGGVVAVLWALDRDGSWKAVLNSFYRPQVGYAPASKRFDDNAQQFVAAVAGRDCEGFWRLLNVGSRFVRAPGGDRAQFCRDIAKTYKLKEGGIADIAADPSARPKQLGTTREVGFYGLELKSGRYLALVLTGRLGGIADAEQKQHDDPSVVEIVTVRPPAK